MLTSFIRQSSHSITGHVTVQVFGTVAAAQAAARAAAQALPAACGGCIVRRHRHGMRQAWAVSVPANLGAVHRSFYGAAVRTAAPLVGHGQAFGVVGGTYA